jgi:hypothetical protein
VVDVDFADEFEFCCVVKRPDAHDVSISRLEVIEKVGAAFAAESAR